jgi:hypothetical protein
VNSGPGKDTKVEGPPICGFMTLKKIHRKGLLILQAATNGLYGTTIKSILPPTGN